MKIGDYVLTQKIGKGSYGEVHLGYHKKTKHQIAVKIILTAGFQTKQFEALDLETKTLESFTHPNILKLICSYHSKKYAFLVTEYCPGGDLYNFMKFRKNPIPENVVKQIIFEIATGLDEMHSNNIIHRDLKPRNILLMSKEKPSIKIADFGFSRILDENDLAKTTCGTLLFMAPEIILQRGHDSRVDLWSLGVIWYEIIYDQLPVIAQTPTNYASEILYKEIEFKDSNIYSKESIELVKKLLKKSPDDRLTIKELLQNSYFKKENVPEKVETVMNEHIDKEIKPSKEIITSQFIEEEFMFIESHHLIGFESNHESSCILL
eukprot:gene4187-7497_t